MQRYILFFICFMMSCVLLSQDIVYDSIYGNTSNWMKIRVGPNEILLKTEYENQAFIVKSKLMAAAGFLDGMEKGVDYKDYTFSFDTITYEIQTDVPINVIVYKYQINDTLFNYFVGVRKSYIGASMFDGQYIFISPLIVLHSEVKIFNGIGQSRDLFLSLKPSEIGETDIRDYELSDKVTLQGIYVSRILRKAKTRGVLTSIAEIKNPVITAGPNPTSDVFRVVLDREMDITLRVFDNLPKVRYETRTNTNEIILDVSSYSSGVYFVILIDNIYGHILSVVKLIKK